MKENKNMHQGLSGSQKIIMLLAAFFTVLAVGGMTVFAWFTHQRRIATLTAVDSPSMLYINAAHNEDLVNFDLADIDVTEKDGNGNRKTKKEYIFCVAGSDTAEYRLQLAYTTNNQFEYKIYPAAASNSSKALADELTYITKEEFERIPDTYPVGTTIYVSKTGGALAGVFLNKSGAGEILAEQDTDDTYRKATYGNYGNTHKHAVPIYWQTNSSIESQQDENKEFCNYYILEISWGTALSNNPNYTNSKETDIIYITAKAGD